MTRTGNARSKNVGSDGRASFSDAQPSLEVWTFHGIEGLLT